MRQGQNNNRRPRTRGPNNNGGGSNGGPGGPGSGSGSGGGGNGGGGGSGPGPGPRRPNVPLRHQTFDSNGPDVRIRGNAFQVHEKYLALARDAGASGDRVAAENYLQHAEHYFRIINQINESYGDNPRGRPNRPDMAPGGSDDEGGEESQPEVSVEGRTSQGP